MPIAEKDFIIEGASVYGVGKVDIQVLEGCKISTYQKERDRIAVTFRPDAKAFGMYSGNIEKAWISPSDLKGNVIEN